MDYRVPMPQLYDNHQRVYVTEIIVKMGGMGRLQFIYISPVVYCYQIPQTIPTQLSTVYQTVHEQNPLVDVTE